ncbi:MAG: hypothetical protein AAF481_03465 [Acidobacteriota bacterium]
MAAWWQIALLVLATAGLSALLTLVVLAAWLKRNFVPDLEERLGRTLATSGEEVGDQIREKVRLGVLDAVRDLPTTEILRGAQRSVVDTATGIVKDGLTTLLGDRPSRRDR